ncbi:hypothetical protein [Alienimonas sp. DA493]|uniref:hypothetical protein n=1 Tax=Alienimonas sp. DA493 TaxID=3373605 RepID=UPI0037551FBF
MPKTTLSPADAKYGYEFGEDGLVRTDDALRLLCVGVSKLRELSNPGPHGRKAPIRKGYLKAGVPTSGAVYCLRSIREHVKSLEC